MRDSRDVWIVVPAFNESREIADTLGGLCQLPHHIIVVDDGSSDNTVACALNYPITLLRHSRNLGQGAALRTGFEYALSVSASSFIVTFDSDGQHDPRDIIHMLEPLELGKNDVVLGSRFLRPGDVINLGLCKRVILMMAVRFTRFTTGLNLSDAHNGFRAFTSEAAAKITIAQNRMGHASEILAQIAQLKLRYCEVPVKVTYKSASAVQFGALEWRSLLWAAWILLRFRLRSSNRLTYFRGYAK
jgi:polyprenyl-phospho-N-acetylgalactosaminyl synthase